MAEEQRAFAAMTAVGRLMPGLRLRIAAVIALQAVAGVAENLSLVSLLPIIQTMVSGEAANSGLGMAMRQLVAALGLPATLGSFLLIAIGAATIKAGISILTARYANSVVLDAVNRLRKRLARRLFGMPWPDFRKAASGRVVTVLVTELERLRPAFNQFIATFTAAIQIAFYVVTSFLVSAPLTAVAMVLGTAKILLLRPLHRQGTGAGRRLSKHTGAMSATLVEALQNMKLLKAMGREGVLLDRFVREADVHREAASGIHASVAWMKVLDEYLTTLLLAGVFFLSATVLPVGIAEIAVVGLLINRLLTRFGGLQKSWHTLGTQRGAAEAAQRCLEDWPAAETRGGRANVRFRSEIRLEDVTVGHEGGRVLDHVDMTLRAGRLYAVTGPSGGGKTTLVDTILGLRRPLAGRVLIDGVDLAEIDLGQWHGRIGYVPQEAVLFNDSVLFNLLLDREGATEEDARRALVAAEAWDFVQALPGGLNAVIAERGGNLSGGQRQRLALARALVHAEDLLIVDEATTGLDAPTEAEICRTLRKLAGDLTIIAISHQPAIARVADEVIEVAGGRVRPAAMRQSPDVSKQADRKAAST